MSFEDPFKDFLIEERIALTINEPRAQAKITSLDDLVVPRRERTHFDFSYLDTPQDAKLLFDWPDVQWPAREERFLVWQAAGWTWLFDTEWASAINEKDSQRIVRLQNIMGCANVSYGPPMEMKSNGMWRPGIWIRRVEFQTERHREKLCYCKSAPYETGEAYAEARAQRERERIASQRPSFISDKGNRIYYASEAELLDFANKVREAGGADVLDAFMPSTPKEPGHCLIANALNFGCKVVALFAPTDLALTMPWQNDEEEFQWVMDLPNNITEAQVKALLKATGCEYLKLKRQLKLPRHIGNAARAFDRGEGWTRKYNRFIV